MSAQLRQAAQAALEALGDLLDCPYDLDEATIPRAGVEAAPEQVVGTMCVSLARMRALRAAVKTFRAALAEPQPEPVARAIGDIRHDKLGHPFAVLSTAYDQFGDGWAAGTKIYAAPQAQQPLTEEQILSFGPGDPDAKWAYEDQVYFARAIERAHGIDKP